MIIALIGEKRSGKNTLGEILQKDYDFYPLAFAEKIKKVASLLFDWDFQTMENKKEEIDLRWGISPRDFFTFFGTNFMQLLMSENFVNFKETVGRNFWVKNLINDMDNLRSEFNNFVITDTRFIHEYEYLKKYSEEKKEKLIFIKTKRIGYNNKYRDYDLTEIDIKSLKEDYLIESSSLEDLVDKATILFKGII